MRPGLPEAPRKRVTAALRVFVTRSGDRRLERTFGTPLGLRLLFRALEAALASGRTRGLAAEVRVELRRGDRPLPPWSVVLAADGARARPGRGEHPDLVARLGVADLLRIAVGELDAGDALLAGRLDVEGDFALATRLGALARG